MGQGIVPGTCCASSQQLQRLRGVEAVQTELAANYEAIFGTVDRPGLLTVKRRSGSSGEKVESIFLDAESSLGGSISGKMEPGGHLLHRLPDGAEQRWHILEWSFDPFTPKSASVAAVAEKASTMDSESESEA